MTPPALRTREDCARRDAEDPLAPLREAFALPEGVVYLDGNSLGALPVATAARVRGVIADEWGNGLIGSWNAAGWMDLPRRVGDRIAPLLGAGAGEVLVADSTSVNLYKVLHVALGLARSRDPARAVIVSERGNFPTDLYIAQSVADACGATLRQVEPDAVVAALDASVAVLLLTHVDYRSGRRHDLRAVQRAASFAGVLVVWDLSHSAGAVPLSLVDDAADFAVGCGYKFLNGGPGAPGYVWAHPRHLEHIEAQGLVQPLSGWIGHRTPFAFAADYAPASGIARFQCGTPPVLALAALDCGVATLRAADALGGVPALHAKAQALIALFIALVDEHCDALGLALRTPRDADRRGSQVSFAHATGGYAIVQALIARGVVGDFRAPDLVRFGIAPVYTRFVDVWDAVAHLRDVLASGEWRDPKFEVRAPVT